LFNIVLYEPEIPPNAGNVMRLAANTGCTLHLVRPLGFTLRDSKLARAGMDYIERASIEVHNDWHACMDRLAESRLFLFTTRGTQRYDTVRYEPGDALVFGPESRGLPQSVIEPSAPDRRLVIPMARSGRSINLADAVSIAVYEAWRQLDFRAAP
jgi:tRNA (cytidine/uridine-2'-O-)-methyltransferase